MIKCNSPFGYDDRCVVCMDSQQSFGETLICDTAEDLNYDEEYILQICQYAEKDK